jgi:hypothetical protein
MSVRYLFREIGDFGDDEGIGHSLLPLMGANAGASVGTAVVAAWRIEAGGRAGGGADAVAARREGVLPDQSMMLPGAAVTPIVGTGRASTWAR